jgi:hypothetical protein
MGTLETKIASKAAELAKAQALLSEKDREEIEQREQLEKLEEQIATEKRKARELDLSRRLDAAQEALGDNAKLCAIAIEGYDDSFVIRYSPGAYRKCLDEMAADKKNEKRDLITRKFAAASVYDWNGLVGDDADSEFTARLSRYLSENPGMSEAIANRGFDMSGAVAAARKS